MTYWYSQDASIVTLLSDFGTQDGYVGAMKGAILSRASYAQLVDMTHEIEPHNIRQGAWALANAAPWFPEGTIHLAVVDPDVGTARQPIVIDARGQLFVGPDNGLFSSVLGGSKTPVEYRAWRIENRKWLATEVSTTFHGRDIFAPVAGFLANGGKPKECGPEVRELVWLDDPQFEQQGNAIRGEIVIADRFGNLVSNLPSSVFQDHVCKVTLQLPHRELNVGEVKATYGSVENGEWVAYVGSSGMLEIGVRNGNAASELRREAEGVALSSIKVFVWLD